MGLSWDLHRRGPCSATPQTPQGWAPVPTFANGDSAAVSSLVWAGSPARSAGLCKVPAAASCLGPPRGQADQIGPLKLRQIASRMEQQGKQICVSSLSSLRPAGKVK